MEKMLERLRKLFDRSKGAKPVKSDFMRPKEEPVKKPSVVLSDRKGPLQAVIQDKPPAILLPGMAIAPAPASKPVEEARQAIAPLPPDIDPSQVVIVRHDAKKASGERFRYVDKPLKPLDGESKKPEVIKYSDKKGGEAFKYTPAMPSSSAEGYEKPAEVFKYKPVRVEIKS